MVNTIIDFIISKKNLNYAYNFLIKGLFVTLFYHLY